MTPRLTIIALGPRGPGLRIAGADSTFLRESGISPLHDGPNGGEVGCLKGTKMLKKSVYDVHACEIRAIVVVCCLSTASYGAVRVYDVRRTRITSEKHVHSVAACTVKKLKNSWKNVNFDLKLLAPSNSRTFSRSNSYETFQNQLI